MARRRTWGWSASASLPNVPCFFSAVMMALVMLIPVETVSYFPAVQLLYCVKFSPLSWPEWPSSHYSMMPFNRLQRALRTHTLAFVPVNHSISVCQTGTRVLARINSADNILLMSLYSIISWTIDSLLFLHSHSGHSFKPNSSLIKMTLCDQVV